MIDARDAIVSSPSSKTRTRQGRVSAKRTGTAGS